MKSTLCKAPAVSQVRPLCKDCECLVTSKATRTHIAQWVVKSDMAEIGADSCWSNEEDMNTTAGKKQQSDYIRHNLIDFDFVKFAKLGSSVICQKVRDVFNCIPINTRNAALTSFIQCRIDPLSPLPFCKDS